MSNYLSISDLQKLKATDTPVQWHPECQVDEWCDGIAPLYLTDISPYCRDKTSIVQYNCSRENCTRCKNPLSKLNGHHKIIRENGLDWVGKGVTTLTKKGKESTTIVDMPVFIEIEKAPQ